MINESKSYCRLYHGFTGISEELLLKFIETGKYMWDDNLEQTRYVSVGSVIGTHAGPGAVAIAFFRN